MNTHQHKGFGEEIDKAANALVNAIAHHPTLLGAGTGAAVGGAAGALTADSGDRLRGAGRGALVGGGLGAVGGTLVGRHIHEAVPHLQNHRSAAVAAAEARAAGHSGLAEQGQALNHLTDFGTSLNRGRRALLGTGAGVAVGGALAGRTGHEKQAFIGSALNTVGRGVMTAGMRGAQALGGTGGARTLASGISRAAGAVGGHANLRQGVGALAAGTALVGGGMAAHKLAT